MPWRALKRMCVRAQINVAAYEPDSNRTASCAMLAKSDAEPHVITPIRKLGGHHGIRIIWVPMLVIQVRKFGGVGLLVLGVAGRNCIVNEKPTPGEPTNCPRPEVCRDGLGGNGRRGSKVKTTNSMRSRKLPISFIGPSRIRCALSTTEQASSS